MAEHLVDLRHSLRHNRAAAFAPGTPGQRKAIIETTSLKARSTARQTMRSRHDEVHGDS